ncbi:MAG TPA: trypsin-like peptidase domain-containing protein [Candidatus Paceibacterota bacterium]|nr:trypsin-like peptidase domain-containing protein [Candidatus Paceibacterota bacterium]
MEENKLSVTTIIIIIQVFLIIYLVYMTQNIVIMKKEIDQKVIKINNQTKIELKNQINDIKEENNYQINELTDSLLTIKKDVNSEINEIKANSNSQDFSGIIQEVIKGIVSINTDVAQGSGFIISEDGYIITNAHVLIGGRYARAMLYNEDKMISAKLIGYDVDNDIAILKINRTNLDYLKFENSENVQLGEKVIALGNPLGLSFSVTEGIISGLNREGLNNQNNYIQIDTPLNRGNSGGPLINKKGNVIGINNFKLQESESLGFALDSYTALETINKIFSSKNMSNKIEFA